MPLKSLVACTDTDELSELHVDIVHTNNFKCLQINRLFARLISISIIYNSDLRGIISYKTTQGVTNRQFLS